MPSMGGKSSKETFSEAISCSYLASADHGLTRGMTACRSQLIQVLHQGFKINIFAVESVPAQWRLPGSGGLLDCKEIGAGFHVKLHFFPCEWQNLSAAGLPM